MNLMHADNGVASPPFSDSDAVRSARYTVKVAAKHTLDPYCLLPIPTTLTNIRHSYPPDISKY